MTCQTHQYSDLAQLMALGSHDAGDVVGLPHSGSAPASVNQGQRSIPAPITETQPHNGAQSDMGARLESVRRRLSNPEPGTVQKLRQEQRELIHAILSRGA